MQNWLPDAFDASSSTATAVLQAEDTTFESADFSPVKDNNTEIEDNNTRLFMSESGFAGPETIMTHLTQSERAQVFELVEQDILRDYEQREIQLRAGFSKDLEKARSNFENSMELFSTNLHQAMGRHIKEIADMSARLSVQLAEKIVRSKVQTDHNILVKAIETTLFKVDGAKSIVVNVNPEQASYIESQSELLKRLGINQVVADRRIDLGGCVVRTEKSEWDATVKGQLEYLSELIEEMIATSDEPDLSGEGQSTNDQSTEEQSTDEPSLD